jgi:hypothetical protein
MPQGRGIRAYMDVFTACLRQLLPSRVLDGINTNLFRYGNSCRQLLLKLMGAAVNAF